MLLPHVSTSESKRLFAHLKQALEYGETSTIREQISFIYFFELILMKYVTSGSTTKANISSQSFMSLHFA